MGVSPPHVHGNCNNRDAYCRHHPLWPVQTHKSGANLVANKASACKLRKMLLPPTLGFHVEQYLLFVQTTVHAGQSGSGWVAVTLGECEPAKKIELKCPT